MFNVHIGLLHTMVEGQEAIHLHQSVCKTPRIQPLDPSHQRPLFKGYRNLKCLHGSTF